MGKLNKEDLSILMSLVTGYSALHVYVNRLDVMDSDEYRVYGDDIVTIYYFISHCTAWLTFKILIALCLNKV